jgi:predicted DNA-binding protein (UPF0251 family)
MKKVVGWIINLSLIAVGGFLIYTYFQPDTETVSRSEPIVIELREFDYDEAFRLIQQVSLNQDELNEVKDILLVQTLRAKDELNEDRLLLLKAFVENAPLEWGPSFHMPILVNIQFYLDDIDSGYVIDCHRDSDAILSELNRYTTRFIDSILPYYRNGLAQALNNARTHYNNALDLQEDLVACYSPLEYIQVLESGLTFMSKTLENPAVSNYVSLRDAYFEVREAYIQEANELLAAIDVVKSRVNTLNLHEERIQEQLNAIQP